MFKGLRILCVGIRLVYMKKRENHTILPVLHSEALELPIAVERTEQKPHAEVCIEDTLDYAPWHSQRLGYAIHNHIRTSTSVSFPDRDLKFSRFQSVRKERRVNAFWILYCRPTRWLLYRTSAKRSAFAKIMFIFCKAMVSCDFL